MRWIKAEAPEPRHIARMDIVRSPENTPAAPRYTSYPTAPLFDARVDSGVETEWLGAVDPSAGVSLYLHIPFCETLCWFCACHTHGGARERQLRRYLDGLIDEIGLVAAAMPEGAEVRRIHWGGGSPSVLTPEMIRELAAATAAAFTLAPSVDFSIEINPTDMTPGRLDACAAAGVTRVSVGVQDFDPGIQKAINRIQSAEETRRAIEGFRARGVGSVNLDLIYGLPGQTEPGLDRTLDAALALAPDRVALFGYAHVPWAAPRQRLIDETTLPDREARARLEALARRRMVAAGYVEIGLDHFARPGDGLARAAAEGRLRRNFQGYTDESCEALIGLGASAISRHAQGYAQNAPKTADYLAAVGEGRRPTARGRALTQDDRVRGHVIERLMCDLRFDGPALRAAFGEAAAAPCLATADRVGSALARYLRLRGPERFEVRPEARGALRAIAANFDAHLAAAPARYSST